MINKLKVFFCERFYINARFNLANLMDEELQSIAKKFPEITDVTIPELNQELNVINEVYPYKFPLWGIIVLTVLATILVIICVTVMIAC